MSGNTKILKRHLSTPEIVDTFLCGEFTPPQLEILEFIIENRLPIADYIIKSNKVGHEQRRYILALQRKTKLNQLWNV